MLPVDLPPPAAMRGRWAAFAAVSTAVGADVCHATDSLWHFDDGGGNRAELVLLPGDRALLLGWDREGETYFGAAAEYFDEPATDLLAGAPDWWRPPVEAADRPFRWVGFVYGYSAGGWQRAEYTASDGFDRLGLPAVGDEACRDLCAEFCADAVGPVDAAALAAVVTAGAAVTEDRLTALLGPDADAAAGVAAARRFL